MYVLRSCSLRTFSHRPRMQKGTQESTTPVWRKFHCLFPMGIRCCVMYKESGSHMQTPTWAANAAVAFKLQHTSAVQQCQSLCALIAFGPVSFRKHFPITDTTFQMGFQPYLMLAGSIYFFPPHFTEKERKYTWPGMLLMFLPINLSASTFGY